MINLDEIIKNARVFYEDDHVVVYDKGECLKMMDEAIRQALDKLGSEIDKDLFNEMQIKHINETIEKLKSRLL